MADLEACYFCGSVPEGALTKYAVVPEALDPSPDQQRSVVLCPTCREKLAAVMGGVVAAAEDRPPGEAVESAGGEAPDASPAGDDGAAAPEPDAGDGAAERDGAVAAGDPDGAGRSPADEGEPTPSAGGSSTSADEPAADAGASTADRDATAGTSGDSDATGGAGASTADGGEPTADRDATGGAGAPTAGADEPSGGARGSGADAADDELVRRNSETYGKVLRLLRNREFPIERAEIEQVAANAYQLDPQEVSDAIDAIIQKGLLVQEGAHLRRP